MKTLIRKYQQYLNHRVSDADINQISIYIEQEQIRKLHFEYGDIILLLALKWCETREDYASCYLISDFIDNEGIRYKNIDQWKNRTTSIE